tara:strand:+ start:36726 stop:37445 length:720 start_codon:yes stop_codon:yes gene_type:complete
MSNETATILLGDRVTGFTGEAATAINMLQAEIKRLTATSSDALARKFHETYERLAPDFGYETRKESAVAWDDVPEKNKQLMIAVCNEIAPATSSDEHESLMGELDEWIASGIEPKAEQKVLVALRAALQGKNPMSDVVKKGLNCKNWRNGECLCGECATSSDEEIAGIKQSFASALNYINQSDQVNDELAMQAAEKMGSDVWGCRKCGWLNQLPNGAYGGFAPAQPCGLCNSEKPERRQ